MTLTRCLLAQGWFIGLSISRSVAVYQHGKDDFFSIIGIVANSYISAFITVKLARNRVINLWPIALFELLLVFGK